MQSLQLHAAQRRHSPKKTRYTIIGVEKKCLNGTNLSQNREVSSSELNAKNVATNNSSLATWLTR